RLYAQKNDLQRTSEHFKKIESFKDKLTEIEYVLAFYYMAQANYLFANKQYDKAINTLNLSIATFKKVHDKDSEVLLKEHLVEFYEKINDEKNAYLAQKEFI